MILRPMAANNYFGFTHGTSQYGAANAAAAAAAAYQPAQATYTVGHTAAAAATYTPRAGAAYETATYQPAAAAATHATAGAYAATGTAASATTYEYAYGRTAQTAYDGTKTYYQQPSSATTYTVADTHYQTNKPAYSTTTAYASNTTRQSTPAAAAQKTNYSYSSTPPPSSYTTYTNQATPSVKAAYSGYDAALYNAATMYVQQQATTPAAKPAANSWQTYKKGGIIGKTKPKQPPKPQQLHYCDVCKISCAGPQTYREHLEGQKHKKKEAALKAGNNSAQRGGNSLRCELCDVTCTGADAYAAHIRGAKHQKVVKLHTKLGKPIPSTEPVVVSASKSPAAANAKATGTANSTTSKTDGSSKVTTTPKITFVGGTKLQTTATGVKEEKTSETANEEKKEETTSPAAAALAALGEKEIEPVGQEYIEEMKNEDGKIISFSCKLCECRFNDPNAKEMHMKGRRHRLQYKKKVNPDLVVEVKPSLRQRKLQEEKLRRQQLREELWRRREEERMLEEEERIYWEERRRYEEEMEYFEWYRQYGHAPHGIPPPPPPPRGYGPSMPMMFFRQPIRRPDSSDDRHVIAKHADIYPKEDELQAIQKIVSNVEKALKTVSDHIADADAPQECKKDAAGREEEAKEGENNKKEDVVPPRVLKGVMRVGVLAKGLLLHGDTDVQLVVLCSEKPTRTLLERVADCLPKMMADEDKYELKLCVEEAAIVVSSAGEPKVNVSITLTSPVMREQPVADGEQVTAAKDPPDVLDKVKCLEALASLRHAKWFQARASGLQSCVMVIRILRELCQRVPTWSPLNNWAMELVCERVIGSAASPLSPGDALRRVMEAIAAGILLPNSPGLLDPCEKEPTDAVATLTSQEREDITASAQHALRLLAFRQIHKILGMEPLPPPKFSRRRFNPEATGPRPGQDILEKHSSCTDNCHKMDEEEHALRLLAFRQIHKILGMEPLPPPKFSRGRFNRKRRRDNSAGEGNESEGADGKKDKKEEDGDRMETEKGEAK